MTRPSRQTLGRTAALFVVLAALPADLPCADVERRADAIAEDRPPRHRDYTVVLPGSPVRFDMVAIPGGTFVMGSRSDEPGRRRDEGPRHPVTVRPFWIGKLEVTWDEFDIYMKGRPPGQWKNEKALAKNPEVVTRPSPPYIDETWGFGREGYPVVGISHHAAMEYCYWLSQVTVKAYRLPTEAEWEYACRAGTRTAYSFGDDPGRLDEYAWYEKNSDESTHPVGRKKPNPWGLYDMHGNVAEWCLDHYKTDAYRACPLDRPLLSPVRLPTAARYPHVVRGGSWVDGAAGCRSAARRASDKSWNRRDPERPQSVWWLSDADFVGFRVVRAVTEQPELRGLRSKVTRKSP
jgi:formylglycine-generating enzyme required for sulfatase activity